MNVRRMIAAAVLAASVALGSVAAPAAAQTKKPQLRILVSNDDGYAAPGIDALVEALRTLPNTKVTVVAPATNQSGAGNKTTPGVLTAEEATTASGYPATAVAGTPADSVNYALAEVLTAKKAPNLVVTGINAGQNLGAIADDTSGTVGAARAAVAAGIPAIAVSQGLADAPDYPASVREIIKLVKRFRKTLAKDPSPDATLSSLNVPTCSAGTVRGLAKVPQADTTEGAVVVPQVCTSTLDDPATDIEAFNNGFATLSQIS